MPIPVDTKEQAIYHMILAELHRLHALMLNLQTIDIPESEKALREHFTREQNLVLGKLSEWRQRRPQIFEQAHDAFQHQIRRAAAG